MEDKELEYILVNNYRCKRCGFNKYDVVFYTGDKLLNDKNSVLEKRYVCRNCNFPFDISHYKKQESYNMSANELLNKSIFVNENEKGENKYD